MTAPLKSGFLQRYSRKYCCYFAVCTIIVRLLRSLFLSDSEINRSLPHLWICTNPLHIIIYIFNLQKSNIVTTWLSDYNSCVSLLFFQIIFIFTYLHILLIFLWSCPSWIVDIFLLFGRQVYARGLEVNMVCSIQWRHICLVQKSKWSNTKGASQYEGLSFRLMHHGVSRTLCSSFKAF